MVDNQLKQYGADQVNNQLNDQVNVDGDESDGNMHSGKERNASVVIKKDIIFSGDKLVWCYWPFQVKCPQIHQHSSADSGSSGDKGSKGAASGRSAGSGSRERSDGGRRQETNLMVQYCSHKFAFSVEQLVGHELQSSDLITLIVRGVAVSNVHIDSEATCNMMGQQTWQMLKLKGIKCESCTL